MKVGHLKSIKLMRGCFEILKPGLMKNSEHDYAGKTNIQVSQPVSHSQKRNEGKVIDIYIQPNRSASKEQLEVAISENIKRVFERPRNRGEQADHSPAQEA